MRHAIISTIAAFVTSATTRQTSSYHSHGSLPSSHRRPLQLAAFFERQSKNKKTMTTSPSTAVSDMTSKMDNLDLSKIEKFAQRTGDALFGYIEQSQLDYHASVSAENNGNENDNDNNNEACFGNFLDAGTGSHSLRWMASIIHRERLLLATTTITAKGAQHNSDTEAPPPRRLSMKSFTAITADETMRRRVFAEAKELGVETNGDVVIGNWNTGVKVDDKGGIEFSSSSNNDNNNNNNGNNKKALLQGQQFDTILADYLVGAIDGFSPYFQDQIFHRLAHHLAPGGRMYIIGLQPIPDSVEGEGGNVFCKITKARDACIKLADHRCYREYPLDWIERHVKRAGLRVVESRTYPIRYDHATMCRQINVGRSKLKLFSSKGLAKEMGKVLDDLEKESLEVCKGAKGGRVTLGFDYVLVAERPKE